MDEQTKRTIVEALERWREWMRNQQRHVVFVPRFERKLMPDHGLLAAQIAEIDAAITAVKAQQPQQPVVTDYEHDLLVAIIDTVKNHYQAGQEPWVNAMVIESWLGNYRGTPLSTPHHTAD